MTRKKEQIVQKITAAVNGWSRQAELDADEYGAVYMFLAGYDVQSYIDLLERNQAIDKHDLHQ